ncbi:C39 family peptidase [Heyndrickxia vini]|nr:C39 family peptidase [Heyndrickxia vini]
MKKFLVLLTSIILTISLAIAFESKSLAKTDSKNIQVIDSYTYINIKADPKSKRLTKATRGQKYTYLSWTRGKGYAKGAYKIKVGKKTGYISAKASKLLAPMKGSNSKKSASKTNITKPKNKKFIINSKNTVKLNVKAISQRPELPTGCEITAFTMMVNHAGGKGAKVTKMQMAKEMPRSSNPNKGFIGSPYNSTGSAIYPPGLKKMTKKYTGSYKNMTGATINQIKAQLKKGKVVMMWGKFVYWNINMSHTVALTGYDKKGFYYVDPMDGKKKHLSYSQMKYHYNQLGKRALSY